MTLALNKLRPAPGAKSPRKRVGRGIGSGLGKTAGRGHKGQKSRSGGFHKVGFEGGQMPLQRRLPKRGFTSISNKWVNIRSGDLNKVEAGELTRATLKQAGLLRDETCSVKIYLSGKLSKKLVVRDASVFASAGARSAIRAAGGEIADPQPVTTDPTPTKA